MVGTTTSAPGRSHCLLLAPLAGAWLMVVFSAGCAGYNVGNQTLYPAEISTVYVPIFESASFRRNFGERLTEAVMKEIERKTPYKVVGTPDADSVLSGVLVSETKRLIVQSPTDEPRESEVNLAVQVNWIDRRGGVLQEGLVPIPPDVSVAQSALLVPEVGHSVATAHHEAIRRLAEQIVGLMESPW
jgi:hypothetical protein